MSKSSKRWPITFEVIAGTDIDQIIEAHPDWSEDEWIRVVVAAFRDLLKEKKQ